MNISVVVSQFNPEITEAMLESCVDRLKELNIVADVFKVPGALEIPIMVQEILLRSKPDAVITLGSIIKGDTDHYDAICRMLEKATVDLMLTYHTPIVFEVLMTDTLKKAHDRIHKGAIAADVAVQMAGLIQTKI